MHDASHYPLLGEFKYDRIRSNPSLEDLFRVVLSIVEKLYRVVTALGGF